MTLEKRWKSAGNTWRHLIENSTNVQRNIEHINASSKLISNCNSIVDWGPGGGFVSKAISDNLGTIEHIEYVDICDDHFGFVENVLQDTKVLIGHKIEENQMPNISINPDILVAYSVIYHMPSLEYAMNVLDYWNNTLKPINILVRSFFTEKADWERPKHTYEIGDNLLRGNMMTLDTFSKHLSNYTFVEKTQTRKMTHRNCPPHLDMRLALRRK